MKRFMLLAGCLVTSASISGTTACRACDEEGCTDGFILYLQRGIGLASDVRFELAIGDESFGCQLGDGDRGTCDRSTGLVAMLEPDVATQIMVTDLGHPTEVTLTIIEGSTTNAYTLDLEYEEYQPNGEGCPPTCQTATATVPN